jgi:hypothetical protein
MQVIITSVEHTECGKYFLVDCGKTSAHIYISKLGYINVCCKNASHKVWNKSGRYFRTFQEALDGYKSSEMKAIISAVEGA